MNASASQPRTRRSKLASNAGRRSSNSGAAAIRPLRKRTDARDSAPGPKRSDSTSASSASPQWPSRNSSAADAPQTPGATSTRVAKRASWSCNGARSTAGTPVSEVSIMRPSSRNDSNCATATDSPAASQFAISGSRNSAAGHTRSSSARTCGCC